MKTLVVNAGSSSQKSCLYEISNEALPKEALQPLWESKVNWTQDGSVAEIEVKTAALKPDAIASRRGQSWQDCSDMFNSG